MISPQHQELVTKRVCCDCSAPVTRHSKTGRCRSCVLTWVHNDPEVQAKRLARLRETLVLPEHRATQSAARIKINAERATDPKWRAMQRENGIRVRQAFLASPDAEAKRKAAQAESMRVRAEALFGWCPPELRDQYQMIRRKVGAKEARRIIEAELAGTVEHARRAIANNELRMRLKYEREQREAY